MADDMLSLDEVNEVVGDDVTYWINNPFMDREALTEKVRWWITQAARNQSIPPGISASSDGAS